MCPARPLRRYVYAHGRRGEAALECEGEMGCGDELLPLKSDLLREALRWEVSN
jgi:hypothetical protein